MHARMGERRKRTRIQTSNANHGNAHGSTYFPQRAQRHIGRLGLGCCLEQRPHAQIVGACSLRGKSLLHRLRRHAHDGALAQTRPRARARLIRLANMHAIGTYGKSRLYVVVDYKRNFPGKTFAFEFVANFRIRAYELLGCGTLCTKLQKRRPSAHRLSAA